MKSDYPRILLVNPWICDFAAYDFWAKPMGLLILAALLRQHGFDISYIDCLNRFHPKAACSDPHSKHGMGNYLKTRIPKPPGLEDVPRYFSRYGIKEEWFREYNAPNQSVIFIDVIPAAIFLDPVHQFLKGIRTILLRKCLPCN